MMTTSISVKYEIYDHFNLDKFNVKHKWQPSAENVECKNERRHRCMYARTHANVRSREADNNQQHSSWNDNMKIEWKHQAKEKNKENLSISRNKRNETPLSLYFIDKSVKRQ